MSVAIALRHVAFEHLGILQPLLREKGYTVTTVDAQNVDLRTVAVREGDILIVLGGPLGAYEEGRYPFISEELRLIERALAANVRVLGICLGAQLLARVMGSRVYPGSGKEIGFAPLMLTPAGERSPLSCLADTPVLHWHGDTFDLPSGTDLLASTKTYNNQAFSKGTRLLGLQFHIEVNTAEIEQWLVGHACELRAAGIHPTSLRQDARVRGSALVTAGESCLRSWLSHI